MRSQQQQQRRRRRRQQQQQRQRVRARNEANSSQVTGGAGRGTAGGRRRTAAGGRAGGEQEVSVGGEWGVCVCARVLRVVVVVGGMERGGVEARLLARQKTRQKDFFPFSPPLPSPTPHPPLPAPRLYTRARTQTRAHCTRSTRATPRIFSAAPLYEAVRAR